MGKPSLGCSVCRTRKIKCDQARPACSQCRKSGWSCGGWRSDSSFIFRHETNRIVQQQQNTLYLAARPCRRPSPKVSRVLYPSLRDQGLNFFMSNYVISHPHAGNFWGLNDYLPILCVEASSLAKIGAAVGTACLSHAGKQPALTIEARQMQLDALRCIRGAISDPVVAKEDSTLAAVMLLGIFEIVTFQGEQSIVTWEQHIRGIAQMLHLRGPEQVKCVMSSRLFLQARILISIAFYSLSEAIPDPHQHWPTWAQCHETAHEAPANRHVEHVEQLVNIKAQLQRQFQRSPTANIARLLALDEDLQAWRESLNASWHFQIVPREAGDDATGFEACDHIYADFWVSSIWTSHSAARIMVHLALLDVYRRDAYLTHETKQQAVRRSQAVLIAMTCEIGQSVSFHVRDGMRGVGRKPAPAGVTLTWQLYMIGMLETTTRAQKDWIAERLMHMALCSGNSQVLAFARAVGVREVEERSERWTYLPVVEQGGWGRESNGDPVADESCVEVL